jgi:hypothetical protein
MEVTKVIDYAYPTMMAEKALKDMHNAMLERRYVDAITHVLDASQHLNGVMEAIVVERENAGKAPARP